MVVNSGQKYGKVAMSSSSSSSSGTSTSMSPDIEELHRAACEKGLNTYIDPITGYMVMTEDVHRKRGVCCGSGCRHCPFGHINVTTSSSSSSTRMLRQSRDRYKGRAKLESENPASMKSSSDIFDGNA